MLTAIPSRFLHNVRDLAVGVVILAELGLELLCGCGHNHSGALDRLGGAA